MNKRAFELSPLKAGLAAVGTGAVGGIAGYTVARERARKALANQAQEFAAYNEQENQAIADDAFNQGAEYAVTTTKQSSLKGEHMEHMEKDAGKSLASLKNFFKDLYISGIRDYRKASTGASGLLNEKRIRSSITEAQGAKIREMITAPHRAGLYKNVGAIGATATGLGGAGYMAMRKESELNKEAGEKFKAMKEAFKDLYYSGVGQRKAGLSRMRKLERAGAPAKEYNKEMARTKGIYRGSLAKNVLVGGGTAAGLAGAGFAGHDLYKNSELSKAAKKSAILDFLGKTYTGGLKMRGAFNPKKLSIADAGTARSAYRQEIARNLLAMAGTAGVLGGAGYGVSQM